MRIGMCGAQCTGKSLQALMLEADGYTIVPSASKIAATSGVKVNREGNLSTQFVIIGQIEQQKYTYTQPDLVWERTHIDALAYSQTCDLWGLDEPYLTIHRALAKQQMLEYFDMIFFFPAYPLSNFTGELNNGIRDTDPNYRSKVGFLIKKELDLTTAKSIVVPQGTPDEIHKFIKERIDGEKLRRTISRT